jgi:hypothetical protein
MTKWQCVIVPLTLNYEHHYWCLRLLNTINVVEEITYQTLCRQSGRPHRSAGFIKCRYDEINKLIFISTMNSWTPVYQKGQLIILRVNYKTITLSRFRIIKDSFWKIYIYIYIYMCVCVCVCLKMHTVAPACILVCLIYLYRLMFRVLAA